MAYRDGPYQLGSAASAGASSNNDFSPPADTTWEVTNVAVSDEADVSLLVDADDDGTFEIEIPLFTIPAGGDEAHAIKRPVDGGASSRTNTPLQKLRVVPTNAGTDIVIDGSVTS